MINDDFYKNLETIKNFQDITKDKYFKKIPNDWYIALSDIKNSTHAIQKGKYKQINFIAALGIIGILNIDEKLDLPYIFGGDGASLLIPQSILNETKNVLLEAAKIAKESFDLELRVAIISVKKIRELKKEIEIGKFNPTQNHFQAIIRGEGLQLADELLKNEYEKYKIIENKNSTYKANFKGLECRWQDIPTPKDETLSILIKSLKNEEESKILYEEILKFIDEIVGCKENRNPILNHSNLKLSFNANFLNTEATLFSKNYLSKYLKLFQIFLENILGKIFMKKKSASWSKYKQRVLETTDTEKFDDMIRMVISCDYISSKKLEDFLRLQYESKNIIYGIHKSKSALMTCLIFQRHGKHIHFVDSSNGGYALAAKMMKNQLII